MSRSSRAMMHAGSVVEYLEAVCRVIAECCCRPMVWMGLAEEGEAKRVVPAAFTGFDEDYIKQLDVSWLDTERGRGPAGTAVRTGKPALCNVLTDPEFVPWRQEALTRGYAYVLSLPLIDNDRVLGAITLCAPETNRFSEEEVTLLMRLGSDVAYGIRTLRLREEHAGDIAERRKADEQLRESEERYRVAIESSNDGVALFRGHELIYANRRVLDMLGYDSLEEAQRTDCFLKIHPDDREMVLEYAARRQRGEQAPSSYQCKAIGKDGATMHLEVSVAPVTYRGEPASLAYLRDITERKWTEEALLQSEKKYRSIFDNAIEGIFQTTPDGRYLTVNPALARMYGYDSPEEMMETVTDLQEQQYVVPEDRVRLKALYRQQGFVERFETQVYTKTRHKVWISMNAYAVKDADGDPMYYEGTAENVTERKNLEAQLRQAQKMEAIGTLAGGVAHDFNNLLTVIMGFSNLIQAQIGSDDRLRPYIDQVIASSEKAADLTQRLLAFSRKQRITLEPHNMNDIVKSTAKLLKRLLPEDIELRLELTDADPIAYADVGQMDQVLMNLATNARDAMPRGGVLIIKTEVSALGEEFYEAHGFGRPGRYASFSVSDSGMGMDKKTLERIFDPFFTTKEVGKGTGLGLASVYGTVKQHGGYITVASELRRGTTFQIYLPLVDAPRPQTTAPSERIVKGTGTVLVAEDDRDVRNMLTMILENHGYVVIQAVDGEDAVRAYKEHKDRIDLVILDVVMPAKNGKEALDEITRINPRVKAIFVSGYTGDVVIDKGIQHEGVEFLQKPLSVTALLARVRAVLDW